MLTRCSKASDAVSCINELARRGGESCRAGTTTTFCSIFNARITGVAGGPKYETTATW